MLTSLDIEKFLSDKPLAITTAGLEQLRGHIYARLVLFDNEPRAALRELAEVFAERAAPTAGRPRAGATGIIPIRGTISQHSQGDISTALFGGTATEDVEKQLEALLADESVTSILLDIDSPGGVAYGVPELAAKIRAARSVKPISALANPMAASAAYWIGASADQFWGIPSSVTGSIGVYGVHQDVSKLLENEGVKTTLISAGKFKTDGNQFEPLSDDTKIRMQSRVNDYYDMFVKDVAQGRGVPEASVRSGYGQGDIATAKQAKALGLIDGVMTFDQAVARTRQLRPRQDNAAAAASTFSDNAEQVLVDLQAFMFRAKSLADLRAEDGRLLSEEHRASIWQVIDEARASIQQVESMVTRPVDEAALARLRRVRLHALQLSAV